MKSPIQLAAYGLAWREILLSNFLIAVKNPVLSTRLSRSRAFVMKPRVVSHVFDLLCNQRRKQQICQEILSMVGVLIVSCTYIQDFSSVMTTFISTFKLSFFHL